MKLLTLIFLLFIVMNSRAQGPVWEWARVIHTHNAAEGPLNGSVIAAPDGNVYMCSNYTDTVAEDTFTISSMGMHDLLISKFDSSGNLLQLKSYGGNGNDYGFVRINNAGDIFLAGTYTDSTTLLNQHITSSLGQNIFFASFSGLDSLNWVKPIIGKWQNQATGLIFDHNENMYLCGYYAIYSGDTLTGGYTVFDNDTLSVPGQGGGFLAKYDHAGRLLKVVTDSGIINGGSATFSAISMDSSANINTLGYFIDKSWFGPIYLTPYDGFSGTSVVQYDSSLHPIWGKAAVAEVGPAIHLVSGTTGGTAIKTDIAGNSYIVGNCMNCYMKFDAYTLDFHDIGEDWVGYIAKYGADGTFKWAKAIGNNPPGQINALDLDEAGNIYLAGNYIYQIILGSDTLKATGFYPDIFVTKMDSDGNYIWAVSAGGSGNDDAYSIDVDKTGKNIYLYGLFDSRDLKFGTHMLTSTVPAVGGRDAFIAKLGIPALDVKDVRATANDMITVSPNPAGNVCNVETGSGNYEWLSLISVNGTVVKKERIVAGVRSFSVDLTGLAAGSYYIKAEGRYSSSVQKISVVH